MTAEDLITTVAEALLITDMPEWPDPEDPERREALLFLDDDEDGDEGPRWALAPTDETAEEYVPVDPTLARDLIIRHLQFWLLERGWQVQVSLHRSKRRWRLVDCLSITDGGGDRLDDDYPNGDEELSVLCTSVIVVSRT